MYTSLLFPLALGPTRVVQIVSGECGKDYAVEQSVSGDKENKKRVTTELVREKPHTLVQELLFRRRCPLRAALRPLPC